MVMETSEMIHLVDITMGLEGKTIGTFEWNNFLYISNNGELMNAEKVQMKVDLRSKLLIIAHLDDREISPCEAVQLLTLHLPGSAHPILHTYANWGIDTNHDD